MQEKPKPITKQQVSEVIQKICAKETLADDLKLIPMDGGYFRAYISDDRIRRNQTAMLAVWLDMLNRYATLIAIKKQELDVPGVNVGDLYALYAVGRYP